MSPNCAGDRYHDDKNDQNRAGNIGGGCHPERDKFSYYFQIVVTLKNTNHCGKWPTGEEFGQTGQFSGWYQLKTTKNVQDQNFLRKAYSSYFCAIETYLLFQKC